MLETTYILKLTDSEAEALAMSIEAAIASCELMNVPAGALLPQRKLLSALYTRNIFLDPVKIQARIAEELVRGGVPDIIMRMEDHLNWLGGQDDA